MLGNFNNNEMGLSNSFLNYVLYVSFICIMCIIILNLLVGIAVGELTKTLYTADIQQISMRIVFVLKVVQFLKIK